MAWSCRLSLTRWLAKKDLPLMRWPVTMTAPFRPARKRLTAYVCRDLVGDEAPLAVCILFDGPGDVGREDAVGQRVERAVRRGGFGIRYIETGQDAPLLQLGN